jgi:2-methylcitrate dehydratase PrpD
VLQEDASIGRTGACVSITLKNGRTHTKRVEHALGTLQRPMSDADLEAKFTGLTAETLAPGQRGKVIDLCWQLNSSPDAATLACASVPQY